MKIWIDADACPKHVRNSVYRASERLNLPVCFVSNKDLQVPPSSLIQTVRVADVFEAADIYIAKHMSPADLLITADIPLAAAVVALGCVALNHRGTVYTEENVGEKLATRDLMKTLRDAGTMEGGGPPPITDRDRQNFAMAFDKMLTRRMNEHAAS